MSEILPSTTNTPRRKRFVRQTPPAFQLTERDIELVRLVADYRFLRSSHLTELCQAPHKKICDRLTALFHAGYLDRPRSQFDHYREGGGSSPIAYALGTEGARLLRERGLDAADVDWTRKNEEVGRQYLLHTLMIADVRSALHRSIRHHPGFKLLEARELLELAPEETQKRSRPWCWKVTVQHGSQTFETGVAPDYVFAIQYPDGRYRAYVVECDRGTMPVERSDIEQTSIKRKLLAYDATKRSGLHQRLFGWKTFRTLFITTNVERVEHMRGSIEANVREDGRGLFVLADRGIIACNDVLTFACLDAGGCQVALT